jgi:uncharacterized membrane protein
VNGYDVATMLCGVALLLIGLYLVGVGDGWAASLAVVVIMAGVAAALVETVRRG